MRSATSPEYRDPGTDGYGGKGVIKIFAALFFVNVDATGRYNFILKNFSVPLHFTAVFENK